MAHTNDLILVQVPDTPNFELINTNFCLPRDEINSEQMRGSKTNCVAVLSRADDLMYAYSWTEVKAQSAYTKRVDKHLTDCNLARVPTNYLTPVVLAVIQFNC